MAFNRTNGAQLVAGFDSMSNKLTTGNNYVDNSVGAWATHFMKTKHFVFAGVTNNLLVEVMGSVDGGATYDLTAETDIAITAAGNAVSKTYTTYYTNMRVRVKPAAANTHGTLSTKYAGANF